MNSAQDDTHTHTFFFFWKEWIENGLITGKNELPVPTALNLFSLSTGEFELWRHTFVMGSTQFCQTFPANPLVAPVTPVFSVFVVVGGLSCFIWFFKNPQCLHTPCLCTCSSLYYVLSYFSASLVSSIQSRFLFEAFLFSPYLSQINLAWCAHSSLMKLVITGHLLQLSLYKLFHLTKARTLQRHRFFPCLSYSSQNLCLAHSRHSVNNWCVNEWVNKVIAKCLWCFDGLCLVPICYLFGTTYLSAVCVTFTSAWDLEPEAFDGVYLSNTGAKTQLHVPSLRPLM